MEARDAPPKLFPAAFRNSVPQPAHTQEQFHSRVAAGQYRAPAAPCAERCCHRYVNQALEAGWQGLDIAERFALDDIAEAHEHVEHPIKPGRVIVTI
jgi:hypothetical protein